RPETLDAALLRPGRFDRTVVVDRPDIVGREAILHVHVRNVKLADNVDLRHVAALTPGSVGADLANLVNEAALMAARASKDARNMVTGYGLSRLGRVSYPDQATNTFLPGTGWNDGERKHSEETAREIDMELRKIIADATDEVRGILHSRRSALEAVEQTLMER